MPANPQESTYSSQRRTTKQQLAFLAAMLEGLQKSGFTGVIKIHMHSGGVRGARKEESIDMDWYGVRE